MGSKHCTGGGLGARFAGIDERRVNRHDAGRRYRAGGPAVQLVQLHHKHGLPERVRRGAVEHERLEHGTVAREPEIAQQPEQLGPVAKRCAARLVVPVPRHHLPDALQCGRALARSVRLVPLHVAAQRDVALHAGQHRPAQTVAKVDAAARTEQLVHERLEQGRQLGGVVMQLGEAAGGQLAHQIVLVAQQLPQNRAQLAHHFEVRRAGRGARWCNRLRVVMLAVPAVLQLGQELEHQQLERFGRAVVGLRSSLAASVTVCRRRQHPVQLADHVADGAGRLAGHLLERGVGRRPVGARIALLLALPGQLLGAGRVQLQRRIAHAPPRHADVAERHDQQLVQVGQDRLVQGGFARDQIELVQPQHLHRDALAAPLVVERTLAELQLVVEQVAQQRTLPQVGRVVAQEAVPHPDQPPVLPEVVRAGRCVVAPPAVHLLHRPVQGRVVLLQLHRVSHDPAEAEPGRLDCAPVAAAHHDRDQRCQLLAEDVQLLAG
uniref:Uncharacterized protein n=1 Tax=Anopheles melas TaxID=34690 RepID=A0A182TNT2_9DIPT